MKVTETVQINADQSKIWDTLKSFQNPEKYILLVQNSTINGSGRGLLSMIAKGIKKFHE